MIRQIGLWHAKRALPSLKASARRDRWLAGWCCAVLLSVATQPAWAAVLQVSDYANIQAAVDAAVDGDSVVMAAQTYVEQVTITKAITLEGAGIGQTIVRSPAAASLTQSGGNWTNLKNQDVFAVIGVKTGTAGQVTIRNLTVDGDDQGYLPDVDYPDKNAYDFQGIGVYDSNVIVDSVLVTGVRALASDYGYGPPDVYPDEPSGMNHNASIFAESAEGAGTHTLVVRNSTITKFQKTALLAWGPTLVVDIHDNTLQGYGQTLHSSGNGIQIASSNLSGGAGTSGDRRGTTGSIANNQILGFGHVIPEQSGVFDPVTGFYSNGSYLNLGQSGPSAILLYQAGTGVQITGNTITGPGTYSWHSNLTSNDGGYSSTGVNVLYSMNVTVAGNQISGFDVGILEWPALPGSVFNVAGNTLTDNDIDIWSASGDDQITLSPEGETVAFLETDNGVDTLFGFGAGDAIRVIGFVAGSVNGMIGTDPVYMTDTSGNPQINGYTDGQPVVDFSAGTVSFGNGVSVAAGSVQIAYSGDVTRLYIDTDGIAGPPELQINLDGYYIPQNFTLSGGLISFAATEIPMLSGWGLLLLSGLLAWSASARTRHATGRSVLDTA
ncbi:MAG: hypothetical protein RBT51_08240 [Ectothiorhodospiraceae bacterium]|nr:hypothetical protein [Ectothiorhodospiraceae bacterium]